MSVGNMALPSYMIPFGIDAAFMHFIDIRDIRSEDKPAGVGSLAWQCDSFLHLADD